MRKPSEDLLQTLKQYSGDKLSRTEDLAVLLEAAMQHKALDVLEDLSFHAKFVANSSRALHRVGTSEKNANNLSAELQTELGTVTRLARVLLSHVPVAVQERFTTTYFAQTQKSLQNLLLLCYDLSWYKNWLIDNPEHTDVVQTVPRRERRFVPWRFALLMMLFGVIFWLGALPVRVVISKDLLVPGTIQFNGQSPPAAERELYRVLTETAAVMAAGYVLVLIGSIIYLRTTPLRLRENGWLLMCALLFYVFVPVEVYVLSIDVRMIYLEFFSSAELLVFRELFIARLGALAGTPFIAMLCYFTIIVLAVFQPFKRAPQPSR